MSTGFPYEVFLSHSAKDKAVVRSLAERLRKDGLKVWFDEWEYPSPAGAGEGGRRPGEGRGAKVDSIPAKIEEGLERSRVLSLAHRMGEGARRAGEGCAAHAFGSDWAQLLTYSQPSTFNSQPTTAPLNQKHRFLPLRLDALIKVSNSRT
jgi:hypothetical protein